MNTKLQQYKRFETRDVLIGTIPLGAGHPVRIQSMTSTSTLDTDATVKQAIRMIEAGCEYIRLTTRNIREAENLRNIKTSLGEKGYNTPLIADVHFNPEIALAAAAIVEKVRINPGNYSVKQKNKNVYTEDDYNSELGKIKAHLAALTDICKDHGTVIRIGVNHGSLSGRIMSRYGDTPGGMVESALEFARICREYDFHNLVLSMKSSNTKVMVEANRFLVKSMKQEDMNYPIHLGVTEAGAGEDGRIRSALGIGTLLEEGIGDTIRVSLTEDPEYEIPVARTILNRYTNKKKYHALPPLKHPVPVPATYHEIKENIDDYIIVETDQKEFLPAVRMKLSELSANNIKKPVILKRRYAGMNKDQVAIHAAVDLGSFFLDGFGDAIWIDQAGMESLSLNILQASRRRFSRAEFIACPSCGRTQFNIQEVLKKVKEKTGHLKNLKIAVMGCVVNGPGEMADADYGYVGASRGKVSLYKGKTMVKKNVDQEKAVEELIKIIKESGDWHESV